MTYQEAQGGLSANIVGACAGAALLWVSGPDTTAQLAAAPMGALAIFTGCVGAAAAWHRLRRLSPPTF